MGASRASLPIVVDLENVLIRADLPVEAFLRLIVGNPLALRHLWRQNSLGKAEMKHRLAALTPCDPATLPYDPDILERLRHERAQGRSLVLTTRHDFGEAQRIADHLGIFEGVIAAPPGEQRHCVGADWLASQFPSGFLRIGETGETQANKTRLSALIRICRPYQWSKNLLVFLPLFMSQGWFEPESWIHAFVAFLALSLTASGVYIVNDAVDIDSDRRHHSKRHRPFASGRLGLGTGLAAAVLLVVAGLLLAAGVGVLVPLLVYLVATTLYSFYFKRVVLIDVFLLASLYTLRVIIGGITTGHPPSDWLLAFSCFFFLGLAMAKRAAEVQAMTGAGAVSGRGYLSSDLQLVKMMGIGAGFVSTLVLALYLQDDQVRQQFQGPSLLWGVPAAVLFWICRIWLILNRGKMDEDPLVFAFRDRASIVLGLVAALSFAAATLVDPAFDFWQMMDRLG